MSFEIKQLGIGFAVVKAGTNQIVGRHKTREEAMAQMRALRDTQYEIKPVDGRHHVVRKGDGVMMGTHPDHASAEAHLNELNASSTPPTTTKAPDPDNDGDTKKKVVMMPGHYDFVRQIEDVFEILDWFTGEVVATLTDENAAHTVVDIMFHNGQLTDADFSATEMKRMGGAGTAFKKDDGSWAYPTPSLAYFHRAQQAFGRSVGKERSRLKAYLIRRGKALGASKEDLARISSYKSS